MKFYRKTALFLAIFVLSASSFALTDPEPNPFANLEEGERVLDATVIEAGDEIMRVQSGAEEFGGRPEAIFKYREGGGPADITEFFANDEVRVMVDGEGVIQAVQDKDLLLCDQNFYGWVRSPNNNKFTLETIEGEKYEVQIGKTTQYRDEASQILFGYSPHADDVVRVHGVVNRNVKKIFTETFGAYISLLSEDALTPFLEEIEKREEEEAKQAEEAKEKLETELSAKFNDVNTGNKYAYAINFVADEGIVGGYEDGGFRPDKEINRAEFTKILINATRSEELDTFSFSEKCFPDFEVDAWFAPFVCLAKSEGIINGYADGNFQPSNNINLAEAITILIKTFGFSVDEEIEGEWFTPYLEKAKQLEILPSDFKEANENLTRGEMSELILRALKYQRGELVDYLENSEE